MTPPAAADPTRAEAEALALGVLVRAMREEKVPPAALQAALAVYPRTSAVPASAKSGSPGSGHAAITFVRHPDGDLEDVTDVIRDAEQR